MLREEKIQKDKQFGHGSHTMERISNGIFFILKIKRQTLLRSTEALK
jgi:hypothetical protein